MMKHKLPENWIEVISKTYPDKIYYFNTKTKQTSWEKPTVNETKQVKKKSMGSPTKRKKLMQKDEANEVPSTIIEHNVAKKEIFERKKLIAKRSIKQTQEKAIEEKETPQMKAVRDKMLKRKEKNSQSFKSSKDGTKLSVSEPNNNSSSIQKSNVNLNLKTTCTPQMQILLEKVQEKASKCSSKIYKAEKSRKSIIHKQEELLKSRLRNQGAYNQKNFSKASVSSENRSKNEEDSSKIAVNKTLIRKRTNENNESVEVISAKRSQKSLKKNIAKERMEKLRSSLTAENNDSVGHNIRSAASSSVDIFEEKLPSIYKNAKVRLVRLKERFVNDNKIFVNKNSRTDGREETTNSSTKSVTVVDDLIEQSNEDSLCEEMDWEPMEDEKITFEIQAIRMQLYTENSTNLSCNVPNSTLKYPLLSEQQVKGHLYIIVDTNVFLSNIDAIELARESTFKTYDYPVIVIPWTVIRELDFIKDDNGRIKSTTLRIKARKAVKYINKLFSTKQSRIIGQTPEDVAKNKEKFSIDCPDDEILQTCLQIRDLGKSVVLLSYDVNLCNKAMIYDIVTLGRNDPLEKIDYLNVTNYINESLSQDNNGKKEKSSFDSASILSEELHLSNEIYEDTKSIIRDFLTVVVSKEMYELYGESWEKYVLIKPPWTTVTVLQCAVKHWIAAISESFQRKAEVILKELLQIFKNTSGKETLKDVSYILDKCSALVQMLNIDKHPDLMLRVSKKVDELKEKFCNYESQINDQKLRDAIGVENNIEEQERRAQKAFQYFEAIYVYARDMCGLAAEAIRMPCTFHYNIPNPLPTMDYVKQMQPEIASNVNKLLCSLSAVLEQVKNSSIDYRTLLNLHQTLITFFPETTPATMKLVNFDLVLLDIYCCVKLKEDVLNRGLRQLQELSTQFCRLASYRCT